MRSAGRASFDFSAGIVYDKPYCFSISAKGESGVNYQSTRGGRTGVSAAQAVAQGICGDGGLFVPEAFPRFSERAIEGMEGLDYRARAALVMAPFLTDFSGEELRGCVADAYAEQKFSGPPAPLSSPESGVWFLELWHGPTCAFKDMALQLLPRLLTLSLGKIRSQKGALILVATSGDTGKAALEGFRDVKGTRVAVFYPQNGVSALQERQMRTQRGGNVSVWAVRGNFDDAQTGVKKIFADGHIREETGKRGWMLSSANSINWGRLLPQIVYYFSAWCDLAASGAVRPGEPVDFCVPTGNFGDILAAYYAKKMGLPVGRLVCASNANNVLTEFLKTGVYDRNRRFYTTISPSMDILVSSNLERLLFDLTGGDGGRVAGWMAELARSGRYRVEDDVLAKLHALFWAGCCGDDETRDEIRGVYARGRYLCDPHTAVAARVFRRYRRETGSRAPGVVVSTASPYKFAPDVLSALKGGAPQNEDAFACMRELAALTGVPVPRPLAALEAQPLRFSDACAPEKMGEAVLRAAGCGKG